MDGFSSSVIILISADIEWQASCAFFPSREMHLSPLGEWFPTEIRVDGEVVEIIFFHGGWGKISAAASTQYVIDRWKPDLLLNLGTCGGIEGLVEKRTILLVERTLVYDIFEQMGDSDEHIAHYTTEIDLSWLKDPYPQKVCRALLVSADKDLSIDEVQSLNDRFGAVAGDWESGAIAWVAARNHVRLLILKGVTDLVGVQGGEVYGNIGLFIEATREVMGELISALPGWIALSRK